ncbi:hypothetical protein CDAR_251581 [Caerostris darwini]|uniref:Uncharacterized protein n=1 Tax=Caerostris darwini TaxID=1538125 RepID=A0AAV4RFT1_9ARAC|nr:hypothetical protein CDAR_251581 [Caerostris darwini]
MSADCKMLVENSSKKKSVPITGLVTDSSGCETAHLGVTFRHKTVKEKKDKKFRTKKKEERKHGRNGMGKLHLVFRSKLRRKFIVVDRREKYQVFVK